jgi:prevent-host-death family protein
VATCGQVIAKRRIRPTHPETQARELEIKVAAASYGIDCEVFGVRQAKDRFSDLLNRAANGSQIVIASDGRPKAMIVSYRPVIRGAGWISRRELREKTSVVGDSTQVVREIRDAGY